MNTRLPNEAVRTRRYGEKREAILAAAALVFNDLGVKGATLAGIAEHVGLVQNSVTYYYRKKEDIACACFLRAIEAYRQLVQQASVQDNAQARLCNLFERHAALFADIDQGQASPLVRFDELRTLPDTLAPAVFSAYTDLFREIRQLLRSPHTAGLSRPELNARGHLVFSMLMWQPTLLRRREVHEYARVAGEMATLVLEGMAGEPQEWQHPQEGLGWPLAPSPASMSEAFLRAATELINEQGYKGASIDKIAARLNLTKGSFYHHHDTKDDVVSACFHRSFEVLGRALAHADDLGGQTWSRLSALATEVVRFQLVDGALLRVSAISALPDQSHRLQVSNRMARIIERIGDRIVEGQRDGSLRKLHPAIAASAYFAGINAAAELPRWVSGPAADVVAGYYVRPMMEGVLTPASR